MLDVAKVRLINFVLNGRKTAARHDFPEACHPIENLRFCGNIFKEIYTGKKTLYIETTFTFL